MINQYANLVIITYDGKGKSLDCFTVTQEWWGYWQERPSPHFRKSPDEYHHLLKKFTTAKDAHNFCEAWNAF